MDLTNFGLNGLGTSIWVPKSWCTYISKWLNWIIGGAELADFHKMSEFTTKKTLVDLLGSLALSKIISGALEQCGSDS